MNDMLVHSFLWVDGSKPWQVIEFYWGSIHAQGAGEVALEVKSTSCCGRGLWFSSQHLPGYSKCYVQLQGHHSTLDSAGTRHTCGAQMHKQAKHIQYACLSLPADLDLIGAVCPDIVRASLLWRFRIIRAQ